MSKVSVPFFFVNPKSYLWGRESLELALACDKICEESGIMMFFSCPYTDIRLIAENTKHLVITAQSMDSLRPGRGMGAILPESLVDAGAKAVVLNHAENQKTMAELHACINRAKELDLITIVCADSTEEAKAIAQLDVDIIIAEPTALIGTGTTTDASYTIECCKAIKSIAPDTKVLVASGITTAEDVRNVMLNGADGTGATNGIVNAPSRPERVREMIQALTRA